LAQIDVSHYKKTWEAYKKLDLALSEQTRLDAQYNYETALITMQKAYINWQQQKLSLTPDGRYPAEEQAKSAVEYAKYNLDMTEIHAPADGIVTNINLLPEDAVTTGQNLFAVINFQKSFIRAGLKESYVGRIQRGDRVLVSLRMYPFEWLHGHVVTVGYGVNRIESSSSVITDSTLPYLSQNEDWIQLDQRFPLLIRLDDIPDNVQLRVGSSARILIRRNSAGKA
jgi:multidrug resistance efflux pump